MKYLLIYEDEDNFLHNYRKKEFDSKELLLHWVNSKDFGDHHIVSIYEITKEMKHILSCQYSITEE